MSLRDLSHPRTNKLRCYPQQPAALVSFFSRNLAPQSPRGTRRTLRGPRRNLAEPCGGPCRILRNPAEPCALAEPWNRTLPAFYLVCTTPPRNFGEPCSNLTPELPRPTPKAYRGCDPLAFICRGTNKKHGFGCLVPLDFRPTCPFGFSSH